MTAPAEGWKSTPTRIGRRQFHYFVSGSSLCGKHADRGTTPRLDEPADLLECETCVDGLNRLLGKPVRTVFVGDPSPRGRGWR